jgi:hypothetical protein
VDGPRDQLLAGAVLPGDQHPRIRRRDPRDLQLQTVHRRGLADELLRFAAPPDRGELGEQASTLDRLLRGQEHAVERERLLEEVVGTEAHRPDRRLDVRVAGDHDHGDVTDAFSRRLEHGEAVAIAQPDVQEGQVEGLFDQTLQPLLAGATGSDDVSLVREDGAERLADGRLVVDDENAPLLHAAGSSMMNRAPRGRFSSTRIVPR